MGRIKSLVSWFANTSLARNLRFRLISIVLLASVPTIGLLFLTASQARTDALDTAQHEADRIAVLTASEQAREMDRIDRELSLLSRLPEVREVDNTACTPFFQSLVLTGENQIYVDLRVVGLDGTVHCRSSVSNPLGQNEDKLFIEQAIRQKQFTVGNYRINPLNGRSIVSFATPVLNEDGTVNRAVVATLDLGDRSSGLGRSSMPEGSIVSIVRSDGTLLLQEPTQDDLRPGASLIGTPAVSQTIRDQQPAEEGKPVSTDEGDYIFASAEIIVAAPQPGGVSAYVIVQVPESEVVRRADTVFRDNLAKLGVAVSIAILAAWIGADLFVSGDTETKKTIVAELYHSFSSGVVDHLDTIVATNVIDNSAPPDQAEGLDGLKQAISSFRYAFPDGEVVPREMLADREKVMVRVSLIGTQVGEFQGLPATGQRMIADGIETFAFRDGLIYETWSLMGPLVEMRVVEQPDTIDVEPEPIKPGLWQRLTGRFRRKKRGGDS